MSERPRFPWRQFGMAAALLPISLAMWVLGIDSIANHDLIQGLLFLGSPLVAVAGAIWAVIIVGGHFWRRGSG